MIVYIKILLDCDWLISVQLISNSSAKSVITLQCFVITVQSVIIVHKSVTNQSDWSKDSVIIK